MGLSVAEGARCELTHGSLLWLLHLRPCRDKGPVLGLHIPTPARVWAGPRALPAPMQAMLSPPAGLQAACFEQFPCTQQLTAQSPLATEIMQQNHSSRHLPDAWKCLESFKSCKMLSFPSFSLLLSPLTVCPLDPPFWRGTAISQTVTNSAWQRLPASCSGRQAAGVLPAQAGLWVTHRHAACDYKGKCRPLLFCTGICVSWGYFDLSCALSAH